MRLVGIQDPVNQHISQDHVLKMFRIYLIKRESTRSAQLVAFQALKAVLLELEKFDRILYKELTDGLVERKGREKQEGRPLQQLVRRRAVIALSDLDLKAITAHGKMRADREKPQTHAQIVEKLNAQAKEELIEQFISLLDS